MAADDRRSDRFRMYVLIALDALSYAVVVTTAVLVVAFAGGIATGGGFVRAKLLLFLLGWVLLGVATIRLWPRSPKKVAADVTEERTERTPSVSEEGESTRIEILAAAMPPLRWLESPPRQLSPAAKLFVGAVLVLVTSLVLEVVFAVE